MTVVLVANIELALCSEREREREREIDSTGYQVLRGERGRAREREREREPLPDWSAGHEEGGVARLSGGDERLAPATDCTSGPRFQSLPLEDTPHHTTREDSFHAQQPLVLVEPAELAERTPYGGVGSVGGRRRGGRGLWG